MVLKKLSVESLKGEFFLNIPPFASILSYIFYLWIRILNTDPDPQSF